MFLLQNNSLIPCTVASQWSQTQLSSRLKCNVVHSIILMATLFTCNNNYNNNSTHSHIHLSASLVDCCGCCTLVTFKWVATWSQNKVQSNNVNNSILRCHKYLLPILSLYKHYCARKEHWSYTYYHFLSFWLIDAHHVPD